MHGSCPVSVLPPYLGKACRLSVGSTVAAADVLRVCSIAFGYGFVGL